MPPPEVQKRIVNDFLVRCNVYATERVAHYQSQLQAAAPADAVAICDKLSHWAAYRAFNDYTLREIADGTLDEWFPQP